MVLLETFFIPFMWGFCRTTVFTMYCSWETVTYLIVFLPLNVIRIFIYLSISCHGQKWQSGVLPSLPPVKGKVFYVLPVSFSKSAVTSFGKICWIFLVFILPGLFTFNISLSWNFLFYNIASRGSAQWISVERINKCMEIVTRKKLSLRKWHESN